MHTFVSAVQLVGKRLDWPPNHVYVGMPGNASNAFSIPDFEGRFGKPWHTLKHPLGWQTGYLRYLINLLKQDPAFRSDVKALHGKTLLCWCVAKPTATHCHAFILAEMVELLYHEGEQE